MKVRGIAALLFLLPLEVDGAPAIPQHIMSLTVCTDAMLMDLAPPSRIASISYLSREKAALKLFPEAARLPVNHNAPEEVLAVHPDLILTLNYASPMIQTLSVNTGARLLVLAEPQSFDDIKTDMRKVGDAVGARAEAERQIARMEAILKELAASKPSHPIRVAGWGGGGFVPGRQSLFNQVLEAAGGVNIAGRDGGYYDVESLIAAKPEVLAYADDYIEAPSLRRDQNDHPALMRWVGGKKVIYSALLVGCGLPQTADAAKTLRADLRKAVGR
jgi:iron complex transport system substrate-binding protein